MAWILLTVLAGMFTGIYALPMKFTTQWKWENTWVMSALWGLFLIPWIITLLTIPNLLDIYRNPENTQVMVRVFLLSLVYGVAGVTFGLSLDYLGMAAAYSLNMAMIIVFGSIGPMLLCRDIPTFMKKLTLFSEPKGKVLLLGVVIIIISLILNAKATADREKKLASVRGNQPGKKRKSVGKGFLLCLITGLAAPALNYAFIFGEKLKLNAESLGVSKALSTNAILPVANFGTMIVVLAYCAFLLTKNKTWKLYVEKGTGRYYFYTIFMGISAIGVALFAAASANMGEMGYSIGWAVINASSIFWANVMGVMMGEWKGTSPKNLLTMIVGLIVLMAGVFIVGGSNSL